MVSLDFVKSFVMLTLIFFSASACRFFQTSENPADKTTAPADELKSRIPFSTKEPDNFQAEIVTTANAAENRTLIAKNAANQRYEYNYGTARQLVVLRADRKYLILPGRKIYAEDISGDSLSTPDDWQNFLTGELLNENAAAKFEKIETVENIAKYKVTLDEKASSEIYIYVDEKTGIPVRQEFFVVSGDEKSLVFSVEVKNLKFQTDETLFVAPADFKKVSIEDLRKELNKISE